MAFWTLIKTSSTFPAAGMTAFISTTDEHRWTRMKNKISDLLRAINF
jgi:hypothetical protein